MSSPPSEKSQRCSGSLSYVLGADDRIVSVAEGWNDFAIAQGVQGLTREQIVGQPFARFIADPHTRQMCKLLFDAARGSGRAITLPFRCDSPAVRRFMEFTVDPRPDRVLHIATQLLREETREPVALLDAFAPRTAEVLKICGWCKRIPLPSGVWVEIEEAVRALHLMQEDAFPRLSHGLCPKCFADLTDELTRLGG